MKILLTIILVLAALVCAVGFIPVSMRIKYRESLRLELKAGPVSLNRFIDPSRKKDKKKTKTADNFENTEANVNKKEKKPLADSLSDILYIVKEFSSRFLGHVKVKCAHIDITVGGDDPAKAAVKYGAVVQTVAYITEILKQNTRFSLKRGAYVNVTPDFTAVSSRAVIDITLSVSIFGVIHSLLAAARAYIFK